MGWMITGGQWDFLQTADGFPFYYDGIFDAQARSILDGHLDIPADVPGGEAIRRGDKTYVYFGVFPALLRMPIVALTDRLDGQLATVSMLTATSVLALASFRLNSVLRLNLRGRAPVGRSEIVVTACLAAAVLAGPPLLLAAGHFVFHEVVLWALALSIAAFDAIARWQHDQTGRRLAYASALTTLAMLTRQSVAIGPLLAMVIVGIPIIWRAWRTRARSQTPRTMGPAIGLALAVVVPVLLSTAFHYPRAGQLIGVDSEQVVWVQDMTWNEAIDEYHSIGPKHLPLTVPAYLRPVGIELRRSFPWIDFPIEGLRTTRESLPADWVVESTPSLPSVSPALVICAIGGYVWAVRTRRRRTQATAVLPLILGSVAGASTVLMYWGLSTRYLGDIFPVVVVGGSIGCHALASKVSAMTRPVRLAALMGLGATVALGALVSAALTLELQRERWPVAPAGWRSEFMSWRLHLPGAPNIHVIQPGDPIPDPVEGALLVVGNCANRYVANERAWMPVESPRMEGAWIPVDQATIPPRMRTETPSASLAAECFR